jgi:ABC-type transport system involved in cytochrome bd biosynthesis fused ATPase/permease subunit
MGLLLIARAGVGVQSLITLDHVYLVLVDWVAAGTVDFLTGTALLILRVPTAWQILAAVAVVTLVLLMLPVVLAAPASSLSATPSHKQPHHRSVPG